MSVRRLKTSKRPASPACSSNVPGKKKRPQTPQWVNLDPFEGTESNTSSPIPSEQDVTPIKQMVFKNPHFVHSTINASGKKKSRIWKNLKQILAAERTLHWKQDEPTYGSIEAPPSFKPSRKYSDLSGLQANYTDPHTKIRYVNVEEFQRIKMLTSDIIGGHLTLRKANLTVP